MKWNAATIPKIDCLPAKVDLTLDGGDFRTAAADISAQLCVPDHACIGPVKSHFEVPVTLEGRCKFCVELPEWLAECVRAGRFVVKVFVGCHECARCDVDFVAKQTVKCVSVQSPDHLCEECC